MTVLVLLCVGVLMIGWTYEVIAQDFTVTAVVAAEPLEEGASITYPAPNAVIKNTPLTVSGLCPFGAYVKLYDNGLFSGAVWCAPSGTFQIETDLFGGNNLLLAEDFNQTDQQGPATPGVLVKYQAASPANSSSASAAPLLLTSDFHFQAFVVDNDFTWPVGVEGGTPPYTITIQWGDGQTSSATYKTAIVFQIDHTYKKQGYYTIKIYASDSAGDHRFLQLAAFVKLPGAVGIISTTGGSSTTVPTTSNPFSTFFSNAQDWLWLIWPSFIIVLLMVLSFWLGERQEYHDLLKKQRRLRHQSSRG